MNGNNPHSIPFARAAKVGFKSNRVCLGAITIAAFGVALCSGQADASVHTDGVDVPSGSHALVDGDVYNISIDSMKDYATKRSGIRARTGANVSVANGGGITVNIGSPTDVADAGSSSRGIWVDSGARVDLGQSSAVSMYVDSSVVGVGILNQGDFKANAINVTMHGDSSVALSSIAGDAYTDLGVGSHLTGGAAAIGAYNGSTTIAEGAVLRSLSQGHGTIDLGEGTVTLRNSIVEGEGMGIELSSNAGGSGKVGTINIIGGTVHAKAGSAISSVNSNESNYSHVVNVSGGAVVASDSGLLYSEEGTFLTSVTSTVDLNVSGDGTIVEGRIHSKPESGKKLNLSLSDNATWLSEGESSFDRLVIDGASIEFTVTEVGDKISARELVAAGESVVHVSFSSSFINEIIDILPYAGIAIDVFEGAFDNVIFNYATANQDYKWTIVDNGNGRYQIGDIIAVPEPATYAAVFASIMLGIGIIYRKRTYVR